MQPCWAEQTFKTYYRSQFKHCVNVNKCIIRAIVIIIIIDIVFILQNNSNITILTFMNVDGVLAF